MGIRVETEDIRRGPRRHANSSYFTMVAVDADGQPAAVPPLTLDSAPARRRYDEARGRRRALAAAFASADQPVPNS